MMVPVLIAGLTMSAFALAGDARSAPSFNRDVLPILQKSRQGCHRPGQVAPMSFWNYQSTRPWAKAHFDNSANNRFNPNPNRDVFWGDQTWEEMMIAFVGVIVDPNVDPKKVAAYPREFVAAGRR